MTRHIVDSQSFPLSLPNSSQLSVLSQNGAYAPMSIYTPNDIQNIVVYAGVRGIDVVMVRCLPHSEIFTNTHFVNQEIDTPGHTDAIALSYPDLVACHERTPWSTYVSRVSCFARVTLRGKQANEPPAGQLRFMLPEATSLIVNLFDTLTKLLPSRYFSTGGDEINFPCYVRLGLSSRSATADLIVDGRRTTRSVKPTSTRPVEHSNKHSPTSQWLVTTPLAQMARPR